MDTKRGGVFKAAAVKMRERAASRRAKYLDAYQEYEQIKTDLLAKGQDNIQERLANNIRGFKAAVALGHEDTYRIGNTILREDPNERHKNLVHFLDGWYRFGWNRFGVWLVERPAFSPRFA